MHKTHQQVFPLVDGPRAPPQQRGRRRGQHVQAGHHQKCRPGEQMQAVLMTVWRRFPVVTNEEVRCELLTMSDIGPSAEVLSSRDKSSTHWKQWWP